MHVFQESTENIKEISVNGFRIYPGKIFRFADIRGEATSQAELYVIRVCKQTIRDKSTFLMFVWLFFFFLSFSFKFCIASLIDPLKLNVAYKCDSVVGVSLYGSNKPIHVPASWVVTTEGNV